MDPEATEVSPDGGLEEALGGGEPTSEPTGENPTHVPWDDHVKLRHENAEYRKKWSPYEEVFSGYDDDGRNAWLDFHKLAASDPDTAKLQMLYSLVGEEGLAALGLGGDQEPQGEPQGEQQPEQQPEYLTREEFQQQLEQTLAQRDQQQSEEAAVADVEDTAEQLGYEVGSLDYMQLLHLALTQYDGDLQKAHEEGMQSWKQSIYDEFLKTKASDTTPAPVSPGQGPGGEQQPPRDLGDARKAFSEALNARP